jgi:hypothetical protein
MKKILLKKNINYNLPEIHFYNATDGLISNEETHVVLKYDDAFLHIHFNCLQNLLVESNTYFEHNSEMWNQEVFELFISAGTNTPNKYLEIEINPNNALFVAWVNNLAGIGPDSLTFIEHQASGILHGVQKGFEKWNGFLSIPLALIGQKTNEYRLNFYRIILKQAQGDLNWKCDKINSDFECWSSTMSGAEPAFHRPDAFGQLILH